VAARGARAAVGDAHHQKQVAVRLAMTLQTMSFIFGAILLAVAILGGGFEIKEIKVSKVTRAGRVSAGIVGLSFIGLGLFWPEGKLTEVFGPDGKPPSPVVWMSEREHDKDRLGGDYRGFDIRTDHIEDCENACKSDEKCTAWTYVKPGVQKPQARCYLKNVIPAASDNVCCVSGKKIR
jgi:PAN domain